MKITKAVITAAGPKQRSLPLQTLVDRDGAQKSVLRIIVEEALRAGVDDICVVVCPGDETAYAGAAGDVPAQLTYVPQAEPLGYGHAIHCAREFVGGQPFLHLVGDHLWVSRGGQGCAEQIVEVAQAESCAVSAVQASRESLLPYYGTVGGRRVAGRPDLYVVEDVIEKPTPTEAEQRLLVPGLRAGHYLCFFGIHVLTPAVMENLGRQARRRARRHHVLDRVGRAGDRRALPGVGTSLVALRRGRQVRPAHRPTGARAQRQGSGSGSFAIAGAAGAAGTTGRVETTGVLVGLVVCTCPRGNVTGQLVTIITSPDPEVRNRSVDAYARSAPLAELLAECAELEAFRRASDNLYERVRALFFLYAIHRFHLPRKPGVQARGFVPFDGYTYLLRRRFEEAIEVFLRAQIAQGPNESVSSALAEAYHRLGFQTLADQVRRSVRSVRGNQWMFRLGHPADQPLRVRPELLRRASDDAPYPILKEATPVRMDLSHSAWSDIFFLGMDFPEGARVLNVSIDLGVAGRDAAPRPPVEAYFRVIDEPLLRLASVDLATRADITSLAEVFDFARDYLGLLKAALIAAGLVPPGMEGSEQSLADLLARLVGPGRGIELVSNVNGIPKGSRLAVSTNLLACLIAVCMRATGQARALTGQLAEHERRLVAARAILGEWLAGSGGGWQDSGGVWPGVKLIRGRTGRPGRPGVRHQPRAPAAQPSHLRGCGGDP